MNIIYLFALKITKLSYTHTLGNPDDPKVRNLVRDIEDMYKRVEENIYQEMHSGMRPNDKVLICAQPHMTQKNIG